MKLYALAALVAAGMALSGCASIIKGTSQDIAISTPPTDGATCTLSNTLGSWEVSSPGTVRVKRSKRDINVKCAKPGWQDATATIPSGWEGWTLGNLIFGGLVGVGIDAATGSINEYPDAIQVPMTPQSGTPSEAPAPSSSPAPNAPGT
jgi:hypothetical protein